jgi:DamX protein
LFLMIVSIALFVVYRHATTGNLQVAAEVSEMRTQLAKFSSEGTVDAQAREKLHRLTAELEDIASALGGLDQDEKRAIQASVAAERSVRQQTEERLAGEIRRLGEEQRRLSLDLASLRSALKTSEASGSGESADSAASLSTPATTAVAPTPSPEPEALPKAASDDSGKEVDEGSPVSEMGVGSRMKAERDADLAPEKSDAAASVYEGTFVNREDVYALQLIGFFSRKSIDEFVAREALPARVYLLRQTHKGRPWYALMYGLYDDHAAAEEALSRLPADLVALKPWIRPLKALTELRIIKTGKESERQSVPDRE